MIYYRPTDGGPHAGPMQWRPRTAFLMQQLTEPLPGRVADARRTVEKVLKSSEFRWVDAGMVTTGSDFLLKIWQLAASCPVGIAIVHEGISATTLANIYYELGLMQAYGRETLVIRVGKPALPSDFVRTEFLKADSQLPQKLHGYVASLGERAATYEQMADLLENDPLLSIDYLRRAYLLTGQGPTRERAREIFQNQVLGARSASSVERMMVAF